MTRGLSAGLETAVSAETTRYAALLELRLDSGDVNLWSGEGDLIWNGKTWKGVGGIGTVSGTKESSDLSDTVIRATLSHIPITTLPDFVQEFKDNNPRGREFDLHLAFFDANGAIDDVITLTTGFIDSASMIDGEEGEVQIDLVSEASKLARTNLFRLTDQHQRQLFAGDLGLEFVADLDEEIRWGSANPKSVRTGANKGLDFSSSPIELGGIRQF